MHPDEYRGAILFLFTLVGTASIYYGDEAGIDGILGTNEGCRYPMPWSKDYKDSEVYQMYRTMAHKKAQHKALSQGGMKFLYAQGYVVAIARFCEDEVFVTVISASEKTEKVRLPLGAVGATEPKGKADVFGKRLEYRKKDCNSIELTVEAHQSYFIECQV